MYKSYPSKVRAVPDSMEFLAARYLNRDYRLDNSSELTVQIHILWRKPKMSGRKYAAFLAATARFLRFFKGNWP